MKLSFRPLLAGALLGALTLAGCDTFFVEQPSADPEAVFETLWKTFDEAAGNLEERNVDWHALYAHYRPSVNAGTTDTELFQILTEMLGHIDDSHVFLTAPHQPHFNANRHYREGIDLDLLDLSVVRGRYLEAGYREGRGYVFGRVIGSAIAYIHFGTINAQTMGRLPEMLDVYPDAAGYIIDLRQNDGGNHTFAFDAMGRLTNQQRFVFRSKTRNGPGRTDYTAWHAWHLKPSGRHVDRPIAVLTDRFTPSAAERVVMAFRTLPNATIVGDTTNGTFGTKIMRELANGWYYALSIQKVEDSDGRSFEGIGLAPDIAVRNNRDEVREGVDRVLETAVHHLHGW
jgi:carboxyl-terminal processing protease